MIKAQEADELINSARQAYKNKNFEVASDTYKKLNYALGNSEKYANELAQSLYRENKFGEARENYFNNRSIHGDIDFNIGNTFFKESNYKEAIQYYRSALKKNPQDEEARHNLSLALRNMPKEEKKKKDNPSQNEDNQKSNEKKEQPKLDDKKKDKSENNPPKKLDDSNNKDIEKRTADKLLENIALDEMKTKSRINNSKNKQNKRISKPW